jgi:hypothetical protein
LLWGSRHATDPQAPGAITVRGRVVSGRGKATADLARTQQSVTDLVGYAPFPGSLNVALNRPLRLRGPDLHTFDDGLRLLCPASLGGTSVWLYRWRHAPLHIVEILSSVHLRSELGLQDGDEVVLHLRGDLVAALPMRDRAAWAAVWLGRRSWSYTNDRYYRWTADKARRWGATQQRRKEGKQFMVTRSIRAVVTSTPLIGPLARRAAGRWLHAKNDEPFAFVREEADDSSPEEREFMQVRNLLTYTKTSNSRYSAKQFPAGYHTVEIQGRRLAGQRSPAERLGLVPIDFKGATVLDLGSNQGGMLHQLNGVVEWAVGVDYDPKMVNVANRIACANGSNNLRFYVFDLQKEPLDLIRDMLPGGRVQVCFLLSVCMWLDNWREVIDFARSVSDSMVFESNGTTEQQDEQIDYLRTKYQAVARLAEASEDDPDQKNRRLFYLTDPL